MNKWAVATGATLLTAAAVFGAQKACRGGGKWMCAPSPTPTPTATAPAPTPTQPPLVTTTPTPVVTATPTPRPTATPTTPTPTPVPTATPSPVPSPLTLRADLWYASPFYDPRDGVANDGHGCIGEDNGWDRVWTGALAPGQQFVAHVDFCRLMFPYSPYNGTAGPGGTGFMVFVAGATARTAEPLVDPGWYFGETRSGNHFCIVQLAYGPPTYQGVQPGRKHPGLANGGRWTVTVTGTGSPVVLRVLAKMAVYPWQADECPVVDRDLEPPSTQAPYCADPGAVYVKTPDHCWYDDLPNRPYLP